MYLLTILIITLIHNVYSNYILGGVLDGTTQTREDAEALCLSKYNTHLASIHSESDNKEIEEICKEGNGGIGDFCWIGLKNVGEVRTDGKFEWSDGTDVDYLNWATTKNGLHIQLQPNFSGDCVLMTMKHENGPWNDRACGLGVYKFICNAPQNQLLHCWVGDKNMISDNVYTMCNHDQNRCLYKHDHFTDEIYEKRACSDSNECSSAGCEIVDYDEHGELIQCCCSSNGCNTWKHHIS